MGVISELLTNLEQGMALELVQWFQSGGRGVLWYLLLPFNYIGEELGVMVLLAVVYWSVHRRQGIRLMILVLGAQVFSAFFKVWWGRPRPYHVAPDAIDNVSTTDQPGLPSGHTIFGTTAGLWLGQNWRTRGGRTVVLLFILLMGISRMVHGVHYPQDVAAGWLIGAALFGLFLWIESRAAGWINGASLWAVALLVLVISTVLLVLVFLVDQDFEARKSILAPAGALTGGILGLAIDRRFVKFSDSGGVGQRILRAVVGLVLLAPVHLGLSAAFYGVFGESEGFWAVLFYLKRYGILGFWVAIGIPYVFTLLKLAPIRR